MGVKISGLTAKGATIADTDLVEVSQSAGAGLYTSRSVTGANIKALVTDANMTTSDITTNDVSTAKHGFAPKAPNDTTKFLRGDATWAVPASGGLTEFTEAENTAAPNGTVPVNSLTPVTATTDADVAIVPKGAGAFTLDIADNTTAGGNKRGAKAVDLQMERANANQVASGEWSFIAGRNNRASANYATSLGVENLSSGILGSFSCGYLSSATGSGSLAHGYANTASGSDGSVAMGYNNTASGTSSIALGTQNQATGAASVALTSNAIANGDYSFASGFYSRVFGIQGRVVFGRVISAAGDCQQSKFFLGIRTTGNTATTVTVAGGAASTTNQVILSNDSAFRFKGTIIGKQSGSTNVAAWDVDGIIVRGANAASTTLSLGNVTLVQNTPAWGTPTLAADTTNGGLRVQVTGAAATNIQWTAAIETTEVIYA
jgi:hypothetical protein